jgi:hypothetical protein
VYINGTESSDQLVRKCESDKGCTAIGWGSPSMADNNATCETGGDSQKNVTLPGDICESDDECLCPSNELYNATCTCSSGACKTTLAAGDFCDNFIDGDTTTPGTNYCPEGTWCNMDNDKNCTTQLAEGTVCTAAEQCSTGYGCMKKIADGVNDFTCTKYFQFENGDKFDTTYMRPKQGLLLTVNDACKTHHVIDVAGQATQAECRTAPTSDNVTAEADLKRPDGPAENDCAFTAYDAADNKETAQNATDISKCGFNKDGASYCDKRKGDEWFQAVLKAVQGLPLTTIKCSANSALTNCVDAGAKIGADNFKLWVREMISTDEHGSYGNYADNDNCVGASVTAEFWQGDNPDFAFNSLSMSSFAAIVLTISAMFYMF